MNKYNMHKHITKVVLLAALVTPFASFAAQAKAPVPAPKPAPGQTQGLDILAKNTKGRVESAARALGSHVAVLTDFAQKIDGELVNLKNAGVDVAATTADLAATKTKIETAKQAIAAVNALANTGNMADKQTREQAKTLIGTARDAIDAARLAELKTVETLKALHG